MNYELPSLIALQAFEATLRFQSFTKAAEELGRTQGAISRQVAALEAQIGRPLFHRERPHLRPTPEAERFGERIRGLLDRLAATMIEVRSAGRTLLPPEPRWRGRADGLDR